VLRRQTSHGREAKWFGRTSRLGRPDLIGKVKEFDERLTRVTSRRAWLGLHTRSHPTRRFDESLHVGSRGGVEPWSDRCADPTGGPAHGGRVKGPGGPFSRHGQHCIGQHGEIG
jgi:hypothetical protein